MWKKIGWTSLLLLVTVIVIGAGLTIRHQRNMATPKRAIPEVTQTGGVHVTIKQKDAFIRSIAVPAVRNFQRNRQILPSVVIAQAALESQFGTSDLYSEAHNPFGVKGTYQANRSRFIRGRLKMANQFAFWHNSESIPALPQRSSITTGWFTVNLCGEPIF
nr:glucosaminidase domain-containing protein [Lentilactobacillus parafarraginis]